MICFFLLYSLSSLTVPHLSQASTNMTIHADAAILINASSGQIIYAQNEDQPLGIASMTKIMTEYLVLEAIHTGKTTWNQTYMISEKVYTIANAGGLSNVPLRQYTRYTVRELFDAMAIKSANGAAIALAEIAAGTEGNFVKQMNDKAKQLGLEHYQFINASGLGNDDMLGLHPAGTDPQDENLLSARDTATLAFHLLRDFHEVLETASIPWKIFREGTEDAFWMKNTNAMLEGRIYAYEGMDGLKTGTTSFAGPTFTGTAERNGIRFITVILNSKDSVGYSNSHERFRQATKLLNYGFDSISVSQKMDANHAFITIVEKQNFHVQKTLIQVHEKKLKHLFYITAPLKKQEDFFQ